MLEGRSSYRSVRTYIAFSLVFVLDFYLAVLLAVTIVLALVGLSFFLDVIGLDDDVLLVALRAALAIRTRLCVSEVEAQNQFLLLGAAARVVATEPFL